MRVLGAGRSAREVGRHRICRPAGSARPGNPPGNPSTRGASRRRPSGAFDPGAERAEPRVELFVAAIDLLDVVDDRTSLRPQRRTEQGLPRPNVWTPELG